MSSAADFTDAYVRAWHTNDPTDVARAFAPDATYRRTPHHEPLVGLEAILDFWVDARDAPGTWAYDGHVEWEGPDGAAIRGVTHYPDEARVYDNLWVVRLDDASRATDFTEWAVRRPRPAG